MIYFLNLCCTYILGYKFELNNLHLLEIGKDTGSKCYIHRFRLVKQGTILTIDQMAPRQ